MTDRMILIIVTIIFDGDDRLYSRQQRPSAFEPMGEMRMIMYFLANCRQQVSAHLF